MPATNGNAAYDLSLYEKKEPEKKAERKIRETEYRHINSSKSIRVKKLKRINRTSSLKMPTAFRSLAQSIGVRRMAAAGASFLALMVFFIASVGYQVRENELTAQIEATQNELTKLKNDYDGLMVQYDTKMSDSAIEEYAREKLGMQKRENFQLEWISVGEQEEFNTQDETKKGGLIDVIASYFD